MKTMNENKLAKLAEFIKSYTIANNGKTLVIVDDVVTSGSTAARLASLAANGGARRIVLVSVAKT